MSHRLSSARVLPPAGAKARKDPAAYVSLSSRFTASNSRACAPARRKTGRPSKLPDSGLRQNRATKGRLKEQTGAPTRRDGGAPDRGVICPFRFRCQPPVTKMVDLPPAGSIVMIPPLCRGVFCVLAPVRRGNFQAPVRAWTNGEWEALGRRATTVGAWTSPRPAQH